MQIVMKRKNEEPFPRKGDDINLFERLVEYIDAFDQTWKEKIKPATKEQIEELRNVSQLKKYTNDFPRPYLIFLETMGAEDGGLLSGFLVGTANIEKIIKLYNDYQKYEPEVFETPYLAFFYNNIGMDYSIDLSGKYSGNILKTEVGNVCRIVSESFEKLLFQAAFQQFEKYKYRIEFSASENKVKKGMEKHRIKDIFEKIEEIREKYHLEKAWFGDTINDIALERNISFGVRKIESRGATGFVTGDAPEIVDQIANEIIDIIGARIIKSNLP